MEYGALGLSAVNAIVSNAIYTLVVHTRADLWLGVGPQRRRQVVRLVLVAFLFNGPLYAYLNKTNRMDLPSEEMED
jgi:hypothetical protein